MAHNMKIVIKDVALAYYDCELDNEELVSRLLICPTSEISVFDNERSTPLFRGSFRMLCANAPAHQDDGNERAEIAVSCELRAASLSGRSLRYEVRGTTYEVRG